MSEMEIAVHPWGVPVLSKPEEMVPQLKAEGVTAIEDGYHFFITYPESTVERNAQLLRQAGIRIWSVHAPFGEDYNLSHPDEATRRRAVEYHKYVLERVALAGASVVVIHPGSHAKDEEVPRRIPLLLDSLEELIPVAERVEIRLALENMLPHHPGSDFRELRRVVEEMGSEWLGVCFDTGHAHVAGGVKEGMEVLSDLIINFHLADNDSIRDLHLQPPYGTISWDDFLEVFRSMTFSSPIVVEARPWQGDGYDQLRREVAALLEGKLLKVDVNGTEGKVLCLRCGHLRFGTVEDNWCAC
ncbi:MAG: sugar phosphate isomerase/epimerase family protein [Chloroflexota bacterium]|nr:sugar phosphate isomerase/epimerase family protein [Chloroflexota bacterium]